MKTKLEIQVEIFRLSGLLDQHDSNEIEFKLIEERKETLEWVLGYFNEFGDWIGPLKD